MTGRSGKTDLPSEGAGAGGKERPNTKRTGELAEAAFLHKAVGLGLKVTKPWGDSERYDFVVDAGEWLWRVQIKCTAAVRAGGYHIQPIHFVYGKKKVTYTAEDIDVLAAYIIPLDVWYVVPIEAIGAGTSLRLYPEGGCRVARFEQFREGWELFGGEARPVSEVVEGESEEESVSIRMPVWKPCIFRGR
jgi:hypothetical protein